MCVCVCVWGGGGGEEGEKRGKLTGGEIISSNNCLFLKFTDAMRTLCRVSVNIDVNKPSVMFTMVVASIYYKIACHTVVRSPNSQGYHKHLHSVKSTSIKDPSPNRLKSKPKHFSCWKPHICWVFGTQTKKLNCLAVGSNETNKLGCALTDSRDALWLVWANNVGGVVMCTYLR